MLARMLAHVDQFDALARRSNRRFDNLIRRSDERHDGSVCRMARIDIEELDALDLLDLVGDLPDDGGVPSFAKIRYAFDQSSHGHGFLWSFR